MRTIVEIVNKGSVEGDGGNRDASFGYVKDCHVEDTLQVKMQ